MLKQKNIKKNWKKIKLINLVFYIVKISNYCYNLYSKKVDSLHEKRKTNVCTGGQSLNKKAFTLIELLAVLVILAIIAIIAVPQILNIINDSKIKSEKISAENYLRAVDISIINKDMNSEISVLDGWYSIQNNGKTLVHQEYPERTLDVQYEG